MSGTCSSFPCRAFLRLWQEIKANYCFFNLSIHENNTVHFSDSVLSCIKNEITSFIINVVHCPISQSCINSTIRITCTTLYSQYEDTHIKSDDYVIISMKSWGMNVNVNFTCIKVHAHPPPGLPHCSGVVVCVILGAQLSGALCPLAPIKKNEWNG